MFSGTYERSTYLGRSESLTVSQQLCLPAWTTATCKLNQYHCILSVAISCGVLLRTMADGNVEKEVEVSAERFRVSHASNA